MMDEQTKYILSLLDKLGLVSHDDDQETDDEKKSTRRKGGATE